MAEDLIVFSPRESFQEHLYFSSIISYIFPGIRKVKKNSHINIAELAGTFTGKGGLL